MSKVNVKPKKVETKTSPKSTKPASKPTKSVAKPVAKRSLPPRPVKPVVEEPVDAEDVEEDNEELEDNFEAAPKVRGPRKKATIEGHIAKYNDLLALLDAEIDRKSREKEKGARAFRSARKIVVALRKELPQVTRSRAARLKSSTRRQTASGITKPLPISKELAAFLKVDENTELCRVEATNGICVYARLKADEKRESMLRWKHLNPGGKRNLQNALIKKAITPDAALSKLLRYGQYKKDVAAGKVTIKSKDKETGKILNKIVTDDLMYYYVMQKLIGVHFLNGDADVEGDVDEEEE